VATASLAAQNEPAPRDATPAPAKDDGHADAAPSALLSAIDAKQLTLTTYTPKQFPVELVCRTAEQLFGKQIDVVDPQGVGARGHGSTARLAHFVVLGRMLLIRDSATSAKAIVDVLDGLENEEIDLRRKSDEKARAAEDLARKQERARANEAEVATQFVEIHPRHVTVQSLMTALEPLRRQVTYQNNTNWNVVMKDGDVYSNNGKLQKTGSVLLLGTEPSLSKLLDRVAQIDHAPTQFNVSVMLVTATAKEAGAKDAKDAKDSKESADETKPDGGGGALPDELVKELERLLPGQRFERWSYGLLRCETHQSKCELRVTTATDGSFWSLQFQSDEFNDETAELELGACNFHCERVRPHPQSALVQSFETHLTARLGEYVVLGAVGSSPTFVVLRVEPVRQLQ
jgi:hypothetical protein